MEDEQDIDAAFSLFDPAFTFSDLLADGDDKSAFANELMPVDPAQTSVSATSGIALDLSGPGQYDIVSVSDEREERQLQQEAQHGRGKCPDVPAYKQRARATQARFRLRQKVNRQHMMWMVSVMMSVICMVSALCMCLHHCRSGKEMLSSKLESLHANCIRYCHLLKFAQ